MAAKRHRGSTLDDFLREEGVYDEFKVIVAKEAIAWQLQQAKKRKISK